MFNTTRMNSVLLEFKLKYKIYRAPRYATFGSSVQEWPISTINEYRYTREPLLDRIAVLRT